MLLISSPRGFEMIILLIAIICLLLPVIAVLDILRRGLNENKLIWILIIILLPVIGSLVYFYNRDRLYEQ